MTLSPPGGLEEDTGGDCLPSEDESPCICTNSFAWACQCFYDFPAGPDYWGEPELCSDDPDPNQVAFVCADDVEDAYLACGALCGDVDAEYAIDFRLNPETVVPCVENAASMTCGTWDPDAEVDYYTGSGHYGMDWGFVAGLVANPEPLWACDDAKFIAASGGGFEVANASSGEFLYELGLRNGDKIVSINNIDIDSYVDAGYAFVTLWGQTSFTLEIVRSSTPMELDYVLFVTQ